MLPLVCSFGFSEGQRTKQGTVGVGRPFLYAFSAYGLDGVDKALQILHVSKMLFDYIPTYSPVKDEFEMNMRLLGARTMKDVVPEMVDASNIHSHTVAVPGDKLYDNNCTYLCVILPSTTFSFRRPKPPTCKPERTQGETMIS